MTNHNAIKPVKICYEHIGGKLGMLLMTVFINKKWICQNKTDDKHFYITTKGAKELIKMGIDISLIKNEKS